MDQLKILEKEISECQRHMSTSKTGLIRKQSRDCLVNHGRNCLCDVMKPRPHSVIGHSAVVRS
ncbi:hypothetical protein JZ751_013713 [Albula glossodonta]|uniref:Uncharacterized protein n=1 Tax=Albula glossodonta TaxID=121402 RepID=A0A8T2P4G5_9TELE|nr:hypothetical protein JZ751_013713 [Albula glossodonta]